MKRLLLLTARLALLLPVLFIPASISAQTTAQPSAQSVAGTWQATLPAPASQRMVVRIEKSADGSLHGGLIFIDRGAGGLPLTTLTFTAPNLTIEQAIAGVSFRGKLSADGQSIDGTWTQAKQSFPLTLALATPDTLWKHEDPDALPPMAASADPAFEVAVIRPSSPDENNVRFNLRARPFTANWCSVKELVKIAYNVRGKQVPGGEPWLQDTKFDVRAEPDTPGMPSEDQTRVMVKKLLTERLHLAAHLSQQDFNVLAVTLDPKAAPPTHSDPGLNAHSVNARQNPDGQVIFQFSGYTIHDFIGFIMNTYQDKLIADNTGLTGLYDITLTVPITEMQGSSANEGDALIRAAQQIGFRFTSRKEPLPIVVIDHVEMPTPN